MNLDFQTRQRQNFEKTWGHPVLTGGFTQVPNDLLRNLSELGINKSETLVLLAIMSVGDGFASANQVSTWLNISLSTVRRSIRRLETKYGLIYRIKSTGQANHYGTRGTILAVQRLAENRQRYISEKANRVVNYEQDPEQKLPTNKEEKTKKIIKDGDGYKSFLEAGKRLIKRG